jgi:formylglycine-generating enzyme required for sulfatase activity
VIRGGCWDSYGWGCRAALRDGRDPDNRTEWMGFRAAAVPAGA